MTTMNNRLTAEEVKKLRQTDFGKKPGFETAETMLTREVGKAEVRNATSSTPRHWHGTMVRCCATAARSSASPKRNWRSA